MGLSVCSATQEAVIERELAGEMGCPICGCTAEDHPAEVWKPEPTIYTPGVLDDGINYDD